MTLSQLELMSSPLGECVTKNVQPRFYPRVRMVRGHLRPDQVHLAVRHLPAPVLPGQEAGEVEGPGAAPHSQGDRPRPHSIFCVSQLGILGLKCVSKRLLPQCSCVREHCGS